MSFLALQVWFSPAFPVGAFAYSHGLEWAVEAGDLTSAAEVRDWIAALIEMGSIRNDAILLSAAWRGEAVNDLALALASSKERYLETSAQGTAFVAALRKSWPCQALEALDGDIAYPVAVGTAARGHSLPLHETCAAFALAFVSALVSAAVRLGPIGQTDGQKIIAALLPAITKLADFAENSTLDDLGACVFRSDLAALSHETQYSRLFRS